MHVVILGSAPLLMQSGLSESLTGRFEPIRVPHWSFAEMAAAFGFDLQTYLYFGGYPGAAGLARDEERWRNYVLGGSSSRLSSATFWRSPGRTSVLPFVALRFPWRSKGYGIYLVFWFGKDLTQAPPEGSIPPDADELRTRLEGTLSDAERRKISVVVIDVSRP